MTFHVTRDSRHPRGIVLTETDETETCRHCEKPIRRCLRTKSRGFIHASGDCKGWVHDVDGWHSCVREGPKWIFAEPVTTA